MGVTSKCYGCNSDSTNMCVCMYVYVFVFQRILETSECVTEYSQRNPDVFKITRDSLSNIPNAFSNVHKAFQYCMEKQ